MSRTLKPQWLVVAKLALDLVRTGALFLDDDIASASARDVLLYFAIYIGHAELRPMSALKISGYIGMPRATVVRRLEEMSVRGLVVKKAGRWYIPLDEGSSNAELAKMFSANLSHIHSASQRLSIMDS